MTHPRCSNVSLGRMILLVVGALVCFVAKVNSFEGSVGRRRSPFVPQRKPSITHLKLQAPDISPATGLPNRFYDWKHGQKIRYQSTDLKGEASKGPPVVLVHGLFVNADHWRKTLLALQKAGYSAYALDLFGCGYSDKPPANSEVAQLCNGERRFDSTTNPIPGILTTVELGTADGRSKRIRDIDLRHPLRSPYNFYTWSELVTDFVQNIVLPECKLNGRNNECETVTLVTNSIGTITGLQAVIDTPDLFNGVFVVAPNFRELHSAEVPVPNLSMPVIQVIQRTLRERGQSLFDALAKPKTVKQILKEPYAITSEVDDVLVEVLLNPLLTPGAAQVVFDTLSYSAGPLPEVQLSQFPPNKPVWVGYGTADPWTPGPRVEALLEKPCVEKVQAWEGVGHCPHDEAPEFVNAMLFDFLNRVQQTEQEDIYQSTPLADLVDMPHERETEEPSIIREPSTPYFINNPYR